MKASASTLSLAAAMQAALGARAATVASEASMTLLGFGGSGTSSPVFAVFLTRPSPLLPVVFCPPPPSLTHQTPLNLTHLTHPPGAWWPYDLYNFPDAVRANLSSLLFSDTGLGLTSYRYSIGGGGVNVSNPTRAPETFYVDNGMLCFDAKSSSP